MLQSLRFCLSGAGAKMSPATRKQLTPILLGMIGSSEDATRSVASACTGVLCLSLPEEELTDLLIQHLLGKMHLIDLFHRNEFFFHGKMCLFSNCQKKN